MSTLFYLEMTVIIISIICYFLSVAKESTFEQRMCFLAIAACLQIMLIPFELLLKQNYFVSIALFGIFGLKAALTAFLEAKKTNAKEEEWFLK